MVLLLPEFISEDCATWLRSCCDDIFGEVYNRKRLMDSMWDGDELTATEKLVREALDGKDQRKGLMGAWSSG